jgi:hypothetical protein
MVKKWGIFIDDIWASAFFWRILQIYGHDFFLIF